MQMDGQTDMPKPVAAFHNPENVPKNAAQAHMRARVLWNVRVFVSFPQLSTSASPSQASLSYGPLTMHT
jgi:hypothetical protein